MGNFGTGVASRADDKYREEGTATGASIGGGVETQLNDLVPN
jgi:hypothetical protein